MEGTNTTTATTKSRPRNLRKTTAKPDYYLPTAASKEAKSKAAKASTKPRGKKKRTKTTTGPPAKKKNKSQQQAQKQQYYEVESILGMKQHGKKRTITLYEVKWKGYDETTWEPKSNLNRLALAEALTAEQLEQATEEEPEKAAAAVEEATTDG